MTKPRKSFVKPLSFTILILSLVFLIGFYFWRSSAPLLSTKEKSSTTQSNQEKKPSLNKTSNMEALIKETFSLSKEGMVMNAPFISGKTNISTVENTFGKPTNSGAYEDYPAYHIVLGHLGEIVNDIRSYDPKYQTIHLKDIKKLGGEPDDVRYFKDLNHDQIILVYQVNSSFELKWILPKPSDIDANPKVDHISVYTETKNPTGQIQNNQQKSMSEIINEMSLDEKIGQMVLTGIKGTSLDANVKKLIAIDKIGGIIFYDHNLINPNQSVMLLNQVKFFNRSNPLPLLLSIDQEGGKISRLPGELVHFPTNKDIGSIHNPQFSYRIGTLLGKELKEFGLNLDYAPVLDVNSNPKNPIIGDRSFGKKPELVSMLGIQTMKGIQSQNVISTIKHFPGHGDTSVDSHLELPIVNKSLTQLNSLELIPFKNAINSGADIVMVAHILLPKLDSIYPASMSKMVITNILRNQLHFHGVVITDDMTMKAITDHFSPGKAAVDSIKAGSDIILVAHDYSKTEDVIASIKKAVHNGEISDQRINESVTRIITLKRKYKLTDSKVNHVNIKGFNHSIESLLAEYMK